MFIQQASEKSARRKAIRYTSATIIAVLMGDSGGGEPRRAFRISTTCSSLAFAGSPLPFEGISLLLRFSDRFSINICRWAQ